MGWRSFICLYFDASPWRRDDFCVKLSQIEIRLIILAFQIKSNLRQPRNFQDNSLTHRDSNPFCWNRWTNGYQPVRPKKMLPIFWVSTEPDFSGLLFSDWTQKIFDWTQQNHNKRKPKNGNWSKSTKSKIETERFNKMKFDSFIAYPPKVVTSVFDNWSTMNKLIDPAEE